MFSLHSPPYVFKTEYLTELGARLLARLARQQALGIPHLCILSVGIIRTRHHAHLFEGWGSELRSSTLGHKHETAWN